MVSISVSELKAKLSEQLRRVKAGEEVVVTERGRPVAVLSPVPKAKAGSAELTELIRAGLVRPPKHRLRDDFWDAPIPNDRRGAVLAALLAERREGP